MEYIAGLWFLTEKTDRTECFDNDVLPSDCTPTADGGATDWYRQVNETTSYAGFGQVDWRFADGFELTVGGRYSHDKKEIDNDAIAGDFVVINQTFSNSVSESWSAFTPKVALAWLPNENATIYGAVSWGFKSGGFAAAPQGIEFTEPLDQEEALNYEVGIKADLGGNFRVNAAVFYTQYQDLQIQTFGPLTAAAAFGTFQTFNAGDAEIFGAELEATWILTDPVDPVRVLRLPGQRIRGHEHSGYGLSGPVRAEPDPGSRAQVQYQCGLHPSIGERR